MAFFTNFSLYNATAQGPRVLRFFAAANAHENAALGCLR